MHTTIYPRDSVIPVFKNPGFWPKSRFWKKKTGIFRDFYPKFSVFGLKNPAFRTKKPGRKIAKSKGNPRKKPGYRKQCTAPT
jgi:hypothetical protein